jgi:hypothetical protein
LGARVGNNVESTNIFDIKRDVETSSMGGRTWESVNRRRLVAQQIESNISSASAGTPVSINNTKSRRLQQSTIF